MVPEEVTTLKLAGATPGLLKPRAPADTVWPALLLPCASPRPLRRLSRWTGLSRG